MSLREVGKKLVELCRKGQNIDAITQLYSKDIVSVEAIEGQGMPREMRGIDAVLGKGKWWFENHEIHSAEVGNPVFHGNDRFACVMKYDVTFKPANKRMKMEEIALYTVADDKIVREEFFYDMGEMK
ncbi:nuclear transport factor 2 family protein [Humisphaera borealis]|uniref:Nuclear transport factor 2 family protein n=1 Tax=Humisphaera borealis TaxID=2807512 RepID=A0A7M2WW23_9BACT|nr:nuclear transport factor 2 family protein [Humisphaera borealis]QOV89051.1 nuclear transport factor 2 family protein [Humisphaera borealis]